MIQKLIERTNTTEFYQDSDLKLESYNYNPSSNTLEMFLSINQISYDIPIEYEEWKLTCIKTENFNGFFSQRMLPYVKLKVLKNHPLLLKYHENELECEIKGKPENVNEFIGELSNVLEKETGNWITVNEYFWNNVEYYKKYSKRTICIPKSLEKSIKEVCKKHKLNFSVNNEIIGEDKGYADKPKAKVLIFGNEDVSPNDFFLNQHFIIAEEFTAERIK
ncbi:hypothetical protein [Formosa algae]|uniref:Uncharacterized protein n=1 Tax=Formosa algae TaxID=225843 RepID=A0A9X0YI63_9FLAO|nr:hypothetical protein [Formosa algae]MBP1838869.1 hypothetical protein [Formosa algae]MDQ0333646.1 hypothetical protein [Formosa algae]OEI78836.1 hypothetical protein AST99_16800 [Formosa algae]